MRRILTAVAAAALLFSVCVTVFAQQYKAEGSIYSIRREFEEEKYHDYIEDGLVFRIGNTRALADGYRCDMDREYQHVMPYKFNDVSYIPIKFSLENLGFNVEKCDDYSLKIQGGDISAEADKLFGGSGDKVEYRYGVLYASARDIAEFAGLNLYDDGTLIIISPYEAVKKPNEQIINELKQSLEWRASKMYFGDEGFILGIQIHPKDPDIMYARTDVGGCYRWQPETRSWTQLLNVIPREDHELISVLSLMPDPNDTEVVYALV
ncbi:MAG: hypothetical protein PUF72_03135, partial [Clostridiales bacterium]|nr:hypothetical protein [Clostridiales bacterium]